MVSKVGAYVLETDWGLTSKQAAMAAWNTVCGRTMQIRRDYHGPAAGHGAGSIPGAITDALKADADHGRKAIISLKPAYGPESNADKTDLDVFLSSCKAYGLDAVIALWHEPFSQSLSVTQYVTMIQYYSATVQNYYPLSYSQAGYAIANNTIGAGDYYPGDGFVSQVSIDFYCTAYLIDSTFLSKLATVADAHNLPLAIWETGAKESDPAQTNTIITNYWNYIKSFMTARVTGGHPIADVLLFNHDDGTPNAQLITSSGDIQVSLFQSLFDALTVVPPPVPVHGTGSVKMVKMGVHGTGVAFVPSPVVTPKPLSNLWFTLDTQLRRDQIIEGYKSFIWTERYSAFGDCQIITKSIPEARKLLAKNTLIGMEGSYRVMKVGTISDDTDEDGTRLITVTGKSIEKILDDRVAMGVLADTTTTPNWILTGTPGGIARQMFQNICVDAILDPHDTIDFYTPGSFLPAGNLSEPTDLITVTLSPDTLYNSLKSLCDTYNLGFRLIKNDDSSELFFEVYVGDDRTSGQTTKPAVIFDPGMENLSKVSQLTSTDIVKTVAYVFASNGFSVVYAPEADSSNSGFQRRVLLVNSSNNDDAGPELDSSLHLEGLIALAQQRELYAFDGELPQKLQYVYGVDYNLGDLVEERASDGFGNQMMITEQIFVSDDQGERAYPTLTYVNVITPGSWLSEGSLQWIDIDPSITWIGAGDADSIFGSGSVRMKKMSVSASGTTSIAVRDNLVPVSGAYWGGWTDLTFPSRETLIGRNWAIRHRYYAWNGDVFPVQAQKDDWAAGVLSMVSWHVERLGDTTSTPLDDILGGLQDGVIDARAVSCANFGHPIFMRLNWEMNGNWYRSAGDHNPNQLHSVANNSFETTATWTNTDANTTSSRVTTTASKGSHSFQLQSLAAGDVTGGHCTTSNILTQGYACVAGDWIVGAGFVKSKVGAAGRTAQIGIEWYNSAGASLSVSWATSSPSITSDVAWTYVWGILSAPVGAAFYRHRIRILATTIAGEQHWWDDMLTGKGATGPAKYVAAWRYIRDRFVNAGATNVVWVWCPSHNGVGYGTSSFNDFTNYYPGNAYVDWVGIDGYNKTATWTQFADVFNNTGGVYDTYHSAKPVMICETASIETGGSKASWIDNMISACKTSMIGIKAVCWFDAGGSLGYYIDSSVGASTSYINAGHDSYFSSFYVP
jgi:beta-mannanase